MDTAHAIFEGSAPIHPADEFGTDNRAAYTRLIDALADGNVTGVVGAGLSRAVGYPLWSDFIADLRSRAMIAHPESASGLRSLASQHDPLVEAENLKQILGLEDYYSLIKTTFGPRTPQCATVHEDLVRLPLRDVLTTNYDPSIETALRQRFDTRVQVVVAGDPDWTAFLRPSDSTHGPRCVYLHGRADRPESVILAIDDYNQLYKKDASASHVLSACFATRSMLFIGCSLEDGDLLDPLRLMTSIQGGKTHHFALLHARDLDTAEGRRKILRSRYGIEPVFYNPRDDHRVLPILVGHLVEDVQSRGQIAPALDATAILKEVEFISAQVPPEHRALKNQLMALVERGHSPAQLASTTGEDERTSLDREIDTIFTLVTAGAPDRAVAEYRALENREGAHLSCRLRYRIHANIGNALHSKGDWEGAASAYLTATSYFSASKDARALRVLAHLLRQDHEVAQGLAVQLCGEYPEYARAHAFRVCTAPSSMTLEGLKQSVPVLLVGNAEVALALAKAAQDRDASEDAEQYMRAAVKAEPTWPQALATLATHILQPLQLAATRGLDTILTQEQTGRLEESEELLSQAIQHIPAGDPARIVPGLLYDRAIARHLLGTNSDARVDMFEAFRRAPENPAILLAEASERRTEGRLDEAVDCLQAATITEAPDRRDFLLALVLSERKKDDDGVRATTIVNGWLKSLSLITSIELRSDYLRLAVHLCETTQEREVLLHSLDALPSGLIPEAIRLDLRARVRHAMGDAEGALRVLDTGLSLDSVVNTATERDWSHLALCAETLSAWSVAVSIWKRVVSRSRYDVAMRHLLASAQRAHEDALIIELCSTLRENGHQEREIYLLEADVYSRCREPGRAIALLEAWLGHTPDDRDARLRLSVVACNYGDSGHVESDPERLPSADSVESAQYGAAVAFVLRRGSRPHAGVAYAYQLWRRFPDEKPARRALIAAVMDPWAPHVGSMQLKCVNDECAVELSDDRGGKKWIIIERGPNPSPTRSEYPPDHPVSKALKGHATDDWVDVGNTRYQILRVCQPAALRAYECADIDEVLFPDDPMVRKYTTPNPPPVNADPAALLGPAWDHLVSIEERRDRLQDLQQRQNLPLPVLAAALGRTIFETASEHIANPRLSVYCAVGDVRERDRAQADVAGAAVIVLDSTAVATICMLKLVPLLRRLPHQLIIPLSVIREVRAKITEWNYHRGPRLFLRVQERKPIVHHVTERGAAEIAHRLSEIEQALKGNCEIVGGSAVLSFPPEQRNKLEAACGDATLDAIAIAMSRGAVLWSDDVSVRLIASSVGVKKGTWTQAMIEHVVKRGLMSQDCASRVTSMLLAHHYSFISLSAASIVGILRLQKWRARGEAFQAICRQARDVGLVSDNNARVFSNAMVAIWRYCPSEQLSLRAIHRLLSAMATRWSVDRLATGLMQASRSTLGMTRRESKRFCRVFMLWLRRRRRLRMGHR